MGKTGRAGAWEIENDGVVYKSEHVFDKRMFSFHLEQNIAYFNDPVVSMEIILAELLAVERRHQREYLLWHCHLLTAQHYFSYK